MRWMNRESRFLNWIFGDLIFDFEISKLRNVNCASSRGKSWNSFSIKYIFMFFEFSTINLATVDMTALGRLPFQRLLGKSFCVEHRFCV